MQFVLAPPKENTSAAEADASPSTCAAILRDQFAIATCWSMPVRLFGWSHREHRGDYTMKALFWLGLVAVIAGVVLLFVPIPHTEKHGVKAGEVSLGIETRTQEKISPAISGVIVLAGIGLMIAARGRSS